MGTAAGWASRPFPERLSRGAEWGPGDEASGNGLGLEEVGMWYWRGTQGTVILQELQGGW